MNCCFKVSSFFIYFWIIFWSVRQLALTSALWPVTRRAEAGEWAICSANCLASLQQYFSGSSFRNIDFDSVCNKRAEQFISRQCWTTCKITLNEKTRQWIFRVQPRSLCMGPCLVIVIQYTLKLHGEIYMSVCLSVIL